MLVSVNDLKAHKFREVEAVLYTFSLTPTACVH